MRGSGPAAEELHRPPPPIREIPQPDPLAIRQHPAAALDLCGRSVTNVRSPESPPPDISKRLVPASH